MTATEEHATAPPKWRRAWSVTFVRGGIALALGFVVPAGLAYAIISAGSDDPDTQGLAIVTFAVGGMAWAGLFGWWIDHLVARFGRWATLAVHVLCVVPAPALMALDAGGVDALGAAGLVVPGASTAVLWLVTGFVPGSFAPRGQ